MIEDLAGRRIHILSDATGDTASHIVQAALHQFGAENMGVLVFPHVKTTEQLAHHMALAAREKALVVTTLVQPDMREAARSLAQEHRIRTVDVMAGLLAQLSVYLGTAPEGVPGRQHLADEDYFRRVEAVEYTVKADDGKEPRMLRSADIVLVGVSRTSKTPLSVFLAHKGYRVSNVPVVLERGCPSELYRIDQRRIFALTIDPESLRDIRRTRLKTMAMPETTNYGDIDYILAELEWSEEIFRQNPSWPVIDVTRKAVEETAATILKILQERGLTRERGEVGQL